MRCSGFMFYARSSSFVWTLPELLSYVRLGVIELWPDPVNALTRRHHNRGVSPSLKVASIFAYLVATILMLKRLREHGEPMDKSAVSRFISKAVTLYLAINTF